MAMAVTQKFEELIYVLMICIIQCTYYSLQYHSSSFIHDLTFLFLQLFLSYLTSDSSLPFFRRRCTELIFKLCVLQLKLVHPPERRRYPMADLQAPHGPRHKSQIQYHGIKVVLVNSNRRRRVSSSSKRLHV